MDTRQGMRRYYHTEAIKVNGLTNGKAWYSQEKTTPK